MLFYAMLMHLYDQNSIIPYLHQEWRRLSYSRSSPSITAGILRLLRGGARDTSSLKTRVKRRLRGGRTTTVTPTVCDDNNGMSNSSVTTSPEAEAAAAASTLSSSNTSIPKTPEEFFELYRRSVNSTSNLDPELDRAIDEYLESENLTESGSNNTSQQLPTTKKTSHPWDYDKWNDIDYSDENESREEGGSDATSDVAADAQRGDLEEPSTPYLRNLQGSWFSQHPGPANRTIAHHLVIKDRVAKWDDGEVAPLYWQVSRNTLWVNGYWLNRLQSNKSYLCWCRGKMVQPWIRPKNHTSNVVRPISSKIMVQPNNTSSFSPAPNSTIKESARKRTHVDIKYATSANDINDMAKVSSGVSSSAAAVHVETKKLKR
eukprot:jgi/Bigna1/127875/aug1.5_g2583